MSEGQAKPGTELSQQNRQGEWRKGGIYGVQGATTTSWSSSQAEVQTTSYSVQAGYRQIGRDSNANAEKVFLKWNRRILG